MNQKKIEKQDGQTIICDVISLEFLNPNDPNDLKIRMNREMSNFISMSSNFEIHELRLLLLIFSGFNKTDKITEHCKIDTITRRTFSTNTYFAFWNITSSSGSATKNLRKALNELEKKVLPDGNERFINNYEWKERSSKISVDLNPSALKYFMDFKKESFLDFPTVYLPAFIFKKKTTLKLILAILQNQFNGFWKKTISLNELKTILELSSSYKTNLITANHLKKIINHINKNSPLNISYTTTKMGREITDFVFSTQIKIIK
jgi:plasmid replication initiation protein